MTEDPRFDRKLAAIFQAEAAEHLHRMHACLAADGGAQDGVAGRRDELFRAAHSLKGAARAVGQVVLEALCHDLETQLAALPADSTRWNDATVAALRNAVHAIQRAHEGPGAAKGPRTKDAPAAGEPHPEPVAATATVRLAVDRLDALLAQVEELLQLKHASGEHVARLRRAAPAGGELQALRTAAERDHRRLGAAVDGLLAGIKHTLLVPVGSLRPLLEAAARELAHSQDKELALRLEGGDVEMDRRLLDELREPLLHLVRNAVAHGTEPQVERRAAGKPAQALLRVAFEPRPGSKVRVTVADDGRGIDPGRLVEAASQAGLAAPAGSCGDPLALVFARGLSTADRLTAVAGRGMGLPIARETVERLGGSISVASTVGAGTTFTMELPVSMATVRAIEVRAADQPYLLPTLQVERCLRFPTDAWGEDGAQPTLTVDDQQVALMDLAHVLQLRRVQAPPAGRTANCVLVSAGTQRVALAVDELCGEHEVLGKPVDAALTRAPIVAGGALVGSGDTVPILNVAELVRCAFESTRAPPPPRPRKPAARHVLVAEDSITSRALLRNILELAGYRVTVAVDGADALRKARAGSFDLVLSDIEMPNMDGFELTAALRADPQLARLPVILVTSLASPADRARGAEAGANAYIVKGSFEQGDLLRAMQELA